jgi:tetratricopeptide (TPR) repeat protein
MNRTKEALANYGNALSIRKDLVRQDPANDQAKRDLAIAHGYISAAFYDAGERLSAPQSMRKSLAIFEELAAKNPEDAQAQRDLFLALLNTGEMKSKENDFAGTLADYGRALAVSENLSARDPANATHRRDLAKSYFSLGEIHAAIAASPKTPEASRPGEWSQAKTNFEKCKKIYQDMRDRREFKSAVQALLDETASAVAKCETALSKFSR